MIRAVVVAGLLGLAAGPAAAQAGDACEVGRTYIDLVQKREFAAVAGLFAPDAVVYAPTGKVYRGAAEIRRFYTVEAAKLTGLVVRPQGFVGSATECYFEIWARAKKDADGVYVLDPDGEFVRNAIDHFTLDGQGRVIEMVAHSAPTANMFKGSGARP
ncbi:MAG: nuclear transport factor 2 family protein [Proteobacteria bacterium]|nr:nuclear transport factor 2 family protein [Pseudomonadota bacterium]MCA0200032.1 nuclear transport factor 2 family protein [Pseudomonadota bacterium]